MRLFAELKRAVQVLQKHPGQWAVCGGVAASIYRESARFTDDIDFALVDSDSISARRVASEVISELGYREYQGFVPDPKQEGGQLNALVAARGSDDERFKGFDFLLPAQCWVQHAVELAQSNCIDYGFAALPTVTPECLIVAKLIALNGADERYQDRDDITEIVKGHQISLEFIHEQLADCDVQIKAELLQLLDKTNG